MKYNSLLNSVFVSQFRPQGAQGLAELALVVVVAFLVVIELGSDVDYYVAFLKLFHISGSDNFGVLKLRKTLKHEASQNFIAVEDAVVSSDLKLFIIM